MDLEKKQSIRLEENGNKLTTTEEKAADFEKAISSCGYGKFHYLLFLAVIPASWASVLDSSNMSMILPSAECDLKLSLFHKGILNGITYAGMVSSALLWGFVADVMGRRRILVYGFMADGICNILCGLSQNFSSIVIFKFLSGFIISGPYATIMSYCAEFYCTKDRPRVTLAVGFTCFAGCIVNAALAWLIVPQNWYFEFGDNAFVYNSWRMYLTFCGIPILFGAFGLSFFPESPKFLMSQGRNDEALEIFKTMYSMNNNKPRDSYPIKLLEDELKDVSAEPVAETSPNSKSLKTSISQGLTQMKPLFMGSYFARLLLVIVIQFGGMLCGNTLRLWQPQLFSILSDSQNEVNSGSNMTFCEILDHSTGNSSKMINITTNLTEPSSCVTKTVDDSVYMFTILVSTTTNACLFMAAALVNLFGNKNLLLICFAISTCGVMVLNWASHYTLIVVLTSLSVGLMSTTTNLVIGVTVNLFPTSLRTMAVSLAMMIGRVGALTGNVMFPVLLDYGCFVAVVSLAVILAVSLILTLFIPPHKENVK